MTLSSFLEGKSPFFTLEALSALEASSSSMESLCSRRDPRGEASRQVDSWLERLGGKVPSCVVSVGFGCGWHLEALASRMPPGALLYVADPSPRAFLDFAGPFDFQALSRSGVELRFSVSESPSAIACDLDSCLDAKGVSLPAVFTHPGSSRAFPRAYAALSAELSKLARRRFLDIRTAGALSSEWLLNSIESLPLSLSCPSIDSLKGSNAGLPAIVIAAGPSLDKSLDWISKASGRAMTICVGTALKSLLAKGIVPDFAVAVDSDPRIAAQFDGVDPSLPFRLLAPPHLAPALLWRFRSRLMLFSTSLLPGMNGVLKACGALPPSLRTSGTVAFTALEAARFAGSSEIFLAGLDLAMGQGGRSHSAGSVYDGLKLERKDLVAIPCNQGGEVFTTPQFAHYVELFDSYLPELAAEGLKVWNASCGGALLKGAASPGPSALAALGELPVRDATICRQMHCGVEALSFRPGAAELLKRLSGSLSAVSQKAAGMLELYGKAKAEGGFSGALLAEMDRLDKEINSDNLAMGLCGDALKALSLGIPASGLARPPGAQGKEEDAMTIGMTMYGALAKASGHLSTRLEEQVIRIGAGV